MDPTRRLLLVATLSLAGCGPILIVGAAAGAGGGGGGGGGGDSNPPGVEMLFPRANGFTDSNAITVRGRASDASGISSLRIGGVDVTTTNAFADWTIDQNLVIGIQTLQVRSEDLLGNVDPHAASTDIDAGILTRVPFDVDFAAAALVDLDQGMQAAFSIDVVTHEATLVTGAGRPQGAGHLTIPIAVASDATLSTLFILDIVPANPTLWSVDVASGARTVVSDHGNDGASTVNFDRIQDLALDENRGIALVIDRGPAPNGPGFLMTVDLASGVRNPVGGPLTDTGEELRNPRSIVYDAGSTTAFVTAAGLSTGSGVFAVDLSNLNSPQWSLVSTGGSFVVVAGLAFSPQAGHLLVLDEGANSLFDVNVSNGNQSLLSGPGAGSGPSFVKPFAIAVDLANEKAYVTDVSLGRILDVELTAGPTLGARSDFARSTIGTGTTPTLPFAIKYDSQLDRAIVVDARFDPDNQTIRGAGALFVENLDSGDRSVLSDGSASNALGEPFGAPGALTLHPNLPIAFVVDRGDPAATPPILGALVAVDLTTGVRSFLSSNADGQPEKIVQPSALAFDSTLDVVYVMDGGVTPKLLRIDVGTGARSVVSDGSTGSGPGFGTPAGLALSEDLQSVFVACTPASPPGAWIVQVDLASGDQTLFSGDDGNGSTRGNGPPLLAPNDLSLDAFNLQLVVSDAGSHSLLVVDIATGDRTVLSSLAADRGTKVFQPFAMDVVGSSESALVLEGNSLASVLVDLTTGDRVVFSH